MNTYLSRRVVISLLIIIAIVGIYFFYQQGKSKNRAKFTKTYQEAKELYRKGDYDEAVRTFRNALERAEMRKEKENTIWSLSEALTYKNADGDRPEAVRLFESITEDQAAPAYSRAFSLNGLAFIYDRTLDAKFMRDFVLDKQPYSNYLQESHTGIRGALRRIYETADALYPNALSKIEIAYHYAIPLEDGLLESGLTPQDTANLVKKYLKDAVPLLSASYEPNTLAYLHLLRAKSIDAIYAATKEVTLQDVEKAYQEAIANAERAAERDDFKGEWMLQLGHIWYAGALAKHCGNECAVRIKELVAPVVSARPPYSRAITSLHSWLVRYSSEEGLQTPRKTYLSIGIIEEEFQQLLIELGVAPR